MTIVSEHAELNEHLNAYLDGALDPAPLRRLERHLESCELCRADLDQLRLTRDALRALPALRAPRPFTIPVEMAPAAGRPAPPWLAWTWRLGSFAAAACLLLAVVSSFAAAPGGTSTALSDGASSGAVQPQRPAALADRDSAQRAGPAPRQPNAQSEQAAAPSAANPAAPASAPAPAAGGGIGGGSGGAAPPPAGFAPAGATDAGAGAATPAAAGPGARAALSPDQPAAQLAPAPSDAQVKSAPPPPPPPGATPWLALAAVLGAGSAALFVVDRRSRVRDP